ncbi:MAG: hypothetical protein AAF533_20285 [Acidobacteriota bacterium]
MEQGIGSTDRTMVEREVEETPSSLERLAETPPKGPAIVNRRVIAAWLRRR